ncbi:septal ring lytic transglycosylase RlpA family protein [Flavobacterium sp. PLA-1-15]|uniref:septal ring lytic transglycosylase RlpA family protein n=1 Tax=Flavobacterium sp. PLA-1-15 TaxID=3380533 RepID=UPI003B7F2E37
MKKSALKIFSLTLLLSFFFLSCSSSKNASGKVLKSKAEASYYHDKFNGRKTASGEKFSNSKLTAAHRTLSFGTKVKVTNLANDKSVVVEINDRGPFKKSREIDLSKKAFMEITDNKNHGTLKVRIEVLK